MRALANTAEEAQARHARLHGGAGDQRDEKSLRVLRVRARGRPARGLGGQGQLLPRHGVLHRYAHQSFTHVFVDIYTHMYV